MGLSTEEEQLSKMHLYWPNSGIKCDEWNDIARSGPTLSRRFLVI